MVIEKEKISDYFFNNALVAGDLFGELSPESQTSLSGIKRELEFAENEIIWEYGKMPCCIYILVEGEAEILYRGVQSVHRIKQNEILGVTEAISNLPYEISIKTDTPCRFECIRRDDFIEFLQTESEICFRLLQRLGVNLQKFYRLFH
jgi:CRP-like cAMP-binding protein